MTDKRITTAVHAEQQPASGPPRESFPLAIGATDHLEAQIVAHHAREDAPAGSSDTQES